MKNALLFFLALCLSASLAQAQEIIYEDFEAGVASLPWVGINGTYNGVVPNPDPSGINTSAWVGSYTTNENSDFNFAIADLPAPADLSNANLFKVKIWSPIAPTKVLLKLEGSGPATEQIRDINVANEWVEVNFDLSAGAANPTGLTKMLIAFHTYFTLPSVTETFYFDDIRAVEAVECYETFETGNELGWQALDGTLEAPVANPTPNQVNSSTNVGKYIKSGAHAYSLLLADNGTPFDLSLLNQWSLDILATAPTQVLLKLEGPGGPPIEVIKNIAVANAWQTYTFDLSAAKDYTHLTKVILFFDPGVETSADTYYFDNLCAVPQGACANVTPNPDIIDDFECNRNATYLNGWDSLSVVANPQPSPVNPSAKVGRYGDPQGEPWATLLIDYQNPIDLSVKNQLRAKILSPTTGQILFKLEGGTSPAKEVFMDIPAANQWVEYVVDFGDQALANHKRIAIFFNAGVEPSPGDVYYIDDILLAENPLTVLEDFETGASLPWAPLDDQTLLHGIFQQVDNPNAGGVNNSSEVGKYTKGTSPFSTLAAVAPGIFDISVKPQFNLDVLAPAGGGTVTMQLESSSQIVDVTRDLDGGEWETVSFDFSDYQGLTDPWVGMRLVFNPGTAEQGAMFFFDNLTQSASTVDPCEDILPVPNIIDDFECQRNVDYGAGADRLTVVANPETAPLNQSTTVGLYKDVAGQPWEALCAQYPGSIDLSIFNQLQLMVLAPDNLTAPIPVLLKLEGGTSPAAEIWTEITTPGEWQRLTADFSAQAGADHTRACFFFNGGISPTEEDLYYIDNLRFAQAPLTGCILNFEEPAFTATTWKFFPADDSGTFELVDNPDKSGINTSDKVGKAVEKASSGQPWQGMYADLPAYIDLTNTKLVHMKVWAPDVASVTLKLENPQNPNAPGGSGDNTVQNTKAMEWEDLTFDFAVSPTPLPDDGQYQRVTLIFDINNIPASDRIWYFDDIRLEGGDCGTTGVFDAVDVAPLSISPNPANHSLRVENMENVSRLEIFNLFGKRLASVLTGGDSQVELDLSNFPAGLFMLASYSKEGVLTGNARFVKQ